MTRKGDGRGTHRKLVAKALSGLAPDALRRRARVITLERRVAHFRTLIISPVVLGGGALVLSTLGKWACLSPIQAVLAAASLELLASYYMAGTIVGTLTWLAGSGGIPRLLLVRLWLLGIAGFMSSVAVAVQFLAWRCI